MRAWDFALYFTICINLAIAIVSNPAINILGTNPVYYTEYQSQFLFNLNDTSSFNATAATQTTDYAAQASLGASFVSFILSMLTGFVAIYWVLVNQLYIPPLWAGFYQVVVYVIYALGFLSLVTGRHPDGQM
jgi:hypothetical protein